MAAAKQPSLLVSLRVARRNYARTRSFNGAAMSLSIVAATRPSPSRAYNAVQGQFRGRKGGRPENSGLRSGSRNELMIFFFFSWEKHAVVERGNARSMACRRRMLLATVSAVAAVAPNDRSCEGPAFRRPLWLTPMGTRHPFVLCIGLGNNCRGRRVVASLLGAFGRAVGFCFYEEFWPVDDII